MRSGFVVNVVLHHHLIKPAVDKLELWVIELARVPSIVEVLLELVDLVLVGLRRVPKLLIGLNLIYVYVCIILWFKMSSEDTDSAASTSGTVGSGTVGSAGGFT